MPSEDISDSASLKSFSTAPPISHQKPRLKTVPRTPQLNSLLKADTANDTNGTAVAEAVMSEPFTTEQLQEAWNAFAEQRKKFQAEFQMLCQPFNLEENVITVDLLSPVHEAMLNNIKIELTTFLRERLRNSSIQVTGALQAAEDKKIIYTNREKFEFLASKKPILNELKERLGLDTDF